MAPPPTPDASAPRATNALTGATAQDLRELFAAPERVGAARQRALEEERAHVAADDGRVGGVARGQGTRHRDAGLAGRAGAVLRQRDEDRGHERPAHAGEVDHARLVAGRGDPALARPAFERGLPELARRVEAGEKLALLLVDIDGLRDLNAARGWTAGDDALGTLGAAALAEVADPAHAARWGGDEVVLVLTGKSASAAGANAAADRLREALGAGLGSVAPTLGAGVALAPDHAADVERLLALSDQALAHAKRGGPGRTAVWEPSLKGLRGRDRVAGVLTGSPARDYRSVQAILDTVAAVARLAPLEETLVALVDRVLDVTGAERGTGAWRRG